MSNTLTDYEKAKKIMTIEYGDAPTSESEFNLTILQLFNISSGEFDSILADIEQQNLKLQKTSTSPYAWIGGKWSNDEPKTISTNPTSIETKPIECNCDWNDILRYGCKCGGI